MERTKRAVNPVVVSVKRASSEASKGAERLQEAVRKLKWYCLTVQACVERGRCICKTASSRMFTALLEAKKGNTKGLDNLVAKAAAPIIGVRRAIQQEIVPRALSLIRSNLVFQRGNINRSNMPPVAAIAP